MSAQAIPEFSRSIQDDHIRVTPDAAQQMAQLVTGADQEIEGIRVFVSGGGCGGMAYGMTYAESITRFDKVFTGDGFKLGVDAVALNYLKGCEIDFTQQGPNASFVFNNVFQSVGGSGMCGGCGGGGGGGGCA